MTKQAGPPEVEKRQREFICDHPGCGAGPGQWCRSRTGRLMAAAHADRYRKAVEAGRLPLTDAEPATRDHHDHRAESGL